MEFKILSKTPIYKAFSRLGKRIFQPNGIFYWAGRAKKESDLSGTVGTAMGLESEFVENGRDEFLPFYLEQVKDYIKLPPEKFVAYAPMTGLPKLRSLWKDWVIYKAKKDGNMPSGSVNLSGKLTNPIICNGITNAIFLTTRYFLDEGESIISPEKRWGNYNSIITRQNGITIESFKFFKDKEYNVEGMLKLMKQVAEKQGKVVLILNFPNNPTGYCPKPDEVKKITTSLTKFCEENSEVPVVVLCDDAYEGYVYTDERVSQSIFNELVNLHPYLIPLKLDGSSKEMLMYGARVAAITLGLHSAWYENKEEKKILIEEWENKTKALIRSTISNCSRYNQEVLVDILSNGLDKLIESRKKVFDILKARYDKTIKTFHDLNPPNLSLDPAGGGFFVFINVDGVKADTLADHLLKKYKLGTIAIVDEEEGINGLRVAYCSIPEEKVDECISRIDKGIRDLI